MNHCIGFADIGKKLIAQALALACASNQASDVDKLNRGR